MPRYRLDAGVTRRVREWEGAVARVPYVDATDGPDGPIATLYRDIAGLRGRVLNLHRALANQPAALRAFMVMSRQVRDDAVLAPNLRELAILATAQVLEAPYEQYHHTPIARAVGVTDAQLAALPTWEQSDAFSPLERAVLGYAQQVSRSRDVDDATFAALQQHLSLEEILDLAVTVGWYHLCAAILGGLRIETEDVAPPPA